MLRKVKAAPAPGDDDDEFVMSDDTLDRVGDIIEATGWRLDNFRAHPIALFNHDRDQIIGRWRDVRIDGKRLVGRLELAQEDPRTPIVNAVRALHEQGLLRAVSVGFVPLESEPLNPKDPWGGQRFIKSELLECSLVAVPANPNALSTAKSLNLPPEVFRTVFCEPAIESVSSSRASIGKHAAAIIRGGPPGRKGATMTRSERIQEAQTALNTLRTRLQTLDDIAERTADEQAEYLELPSRVETKNQELAAMLAAERALASHASTSSTVLERAPGGRIETPASIPRPIILPPAKAAKPIDYFFKVATCFALAIKNRTNDVMQMCREEYRHDEYVGHALDYVMRAAPGPALTTQATWAAELVQQGFGEFISTLRANSLYPVLANRGPRFTFGPGAGTIKLPARSATPTVAGAFVGEAQAIPVKKLGLTSVILTPFKMAVISMYSGEIETRSTPQIEGLLREEMTEDTAVAIDTALIDASPASTIRPHGLRYNQFAGAAIPGLTPTAAGTNTEKMVADIKQLVNAITSVNGGRDIVIMLHPTQAMALNFGMTTAGGFLFTSADEAGRKFNVSFVQSTTVTAGMLIAVDAADFASATGDTPRFLISQVATVHDEDTSPQPISTTGTPNVVAAPVRSFFQTDTTGIRMIWDMSWSMRRAGMVSWMQGVTW